MIIIFYITLLKISRLFFIFLLALLVSIPATTIGEGGGFAYAQDDIIGGPPPTTQPPQPAAGEPTTRTFQSTYDDSFRVQIPEGYQFLSLL